MNVLFTFDVTQSSPLYFVLFLLPEIVCSRNVPAVYVHFTDINIYPNEEHAINVVDLIT
jgi:hypothetical protein